MQGSGERVARRTDTYEAYIASAAWQTKRRAALKAAGRRCQICNSPKRLDVHHRTYKRFGQERPGDLTVLCRSCHDLYHERLAPPPTPPSPPPRPRRRGSKKQRQVAQENERLHAVQQQNKRKQKLVREGLASPSIRAGLAGRYRT